MNDGLRLLLNIVVLAIEVVALVDVIGRPKKAFEDAGQKKWLWIVMLLVLPVVVAIFYFAVIRPKVTKVQGTAGLTAAIRKRLPEGELLLEAKNVVAGYVPEVNILNGCDLQLRQGELVGIIGPNGAGKSTLIKALFGLLPIREGSVVLHGQDITGRPAHELVQAGIGYVPQRDNVFSRLSVEENLQMGVYQASKTFAAQRDRIFDMFPRLAERADQRAGLLSGGERQMLAMGRALMMEPSVLLLDEPSAGLSPALQSEVFERAKEINETGVSIIMVEQNARKCLQICDRGYVLDQGQNAYTDSGDALLHDPKVIELYLGTLAKA